MNSLPKKRILLTGASGFVGGRIARDLGGFYDIAPISLRDRTVGEVDFSGVEAVIHCAALVHQMQGAPKEDYFRINHELTLQLATAALNSGVKHFVFLSTAHVFGDSGTMNHHVELSAESACHPKDPYGQSKLAAEEALLKIASDTFKVSIVRPPMVYGEGAKGNLLSLANLIRWFPILPLGYSKNRRSLIYVGNLVHFIDRILAAPQTAILLPQDPQPLSIRQISSLIAKVLHRRVLLLSSPDWLLKLISTVKPGLVSRLYGTLALDSSWSNKAVGYQPKFSTQDGFERMFGQDDALKVARIVTAPEAVEFHLRNTLDILEDEYRVEIIGTNVSKFKERWPNVSWKDIAISRKVDPISDLTSLVRLTFYFIFNRFDIVHSIMPKAGLLMALSSFIARVPVRLHTFTGQTWANKRGLQKQLFVFFDRLTVMLNTQCYTDSQSQSQFLFEHGVQQNGKPLPVLGAGSLSGVNNQRFNVDFKQSQRKMVRERYGIPQDALVYTFIGRKCEDKGIFELLDAFRKLRESTPNTFLLLVGPDDDPSFQERLSSKAPETMNRMLNIGFSPNPELFLAATDIFCLPSHREGFGSVVIEAGAMGVPTIGTNIPGLVDAIVPHETGLLVEKGDSKELLSAMSLLASNPQMLSRFSMSVAERSQKLFASEHLFSLLYEEYQKLSEHRH